MPGTAADEVALLRQRIAGNSEAVRGHLQSLEDMARHNNMDLKDCAEMLLVLAEVLNNIVEHAFHGVPEGWIDCTVRRQADRFAIETCDNGTPLPPDLLSAGALPDTETATEDLPEGGFGWFIVHALADDMVYEREHGQNRLSFSLQIA